MCVLLTILGMQSKIIKHSTVVHMNEHNNSFLLFVLFCEMKNLLGDVAGGLEMVVKGQMAWEASRGLILSFRILFPQISLKIGHYRLSYNMS